MKISSFLNDVSGFMFVFMKMRRKVAAWQVHVCGGNTEVNGYFVNRVSSSRLHFDEGIIKLIPF
jgi:hypothetical protein